LLVVAAALAWTRVPVLRDGFAELLLVEGVEGNTRWDLWAGTVRSFARAPVLGSGLGSYAFVIGLDRPATGTSVLEEAHNDWLEWLSTTGLVGAAVLALLAAALVGGLRPGRLRRLRHELRYPLAAAALALTAAGLHEIVDFGLQIPLNRYLLAVWVGLVFGVIARLDSARERAPKVGAPVADAEAECRERAADATGLADPDLKSEEDAGEQT
jgi:O-antigen ligase